MINLVDNKNGYDCMWYYLITILKQITKIG